MSWGKALWGLLVLTWALEPLPDEVPLLTPEEIEAINAAGMWQADPALLKGKRTSSISREDVNTEHVQEYKWGQLLNYVVTQIPPFDSRTQWKGCVHPIQDTGDCDGSWAISAADVLSDRLCISKSQQAVISPQYVIDCQTTAYGCDGGTAAQAWALLASKGAPTATCVPFTGLSDTCPVKCKNSTPLSNVKSLTPTTFTGVQSIQAAILQSGPVQACFKMYSDFQAYRSGIYVQTAGTYVQMECVKLIGWGTLNGTSYWIGAGSFGTGWGMSGYFNFKMGQQALQLETNAIAANPA